MAVMLTLSILLLLILNWISKVNVDQMSDDQFAKYRLKIYNKYQLKSFSVNNTLRVEYSPRYGFYTVANKDVNETFFPLFIIPFENLFTWFADFPFKRELADILLHMSSIDERIIHRTHYGTFAAMLMSARLYIEKIDFEKIRQKYLNIDENSEFDRYQFLFDTPKLFKDSSLLNKLYIDSFPRSIPVLKNWDASELEFFKNISFQFPKQLFTFQPFYNVFMAAMKGTIKDRYKLEVLEDIFKDGELFSWWYDVVKSRAFHISHDEYLILSEDTNSNNIQINKDLLNEKGSLMIPLGEVPNHKFPVFKISPDFNGLSYRVSDFTI